MHVADVGKWAVFADNVCGCSFHNVIRSAVSGWCIQTSHRTAQPGVTRLSGNLAPAAPSSGARGLGPQPVPCRPPSDCRVPAARCACSAPSARASAELDHASPSASRASTGHVLHLSVGRARARRGRGAARAQSRPRSPRFRQPSPAPCAGDRFRRAVARDAIHRHVCARNARASSAARGTSPGHASASARASANRTGRVSSEITSLAWQTARRQASTTSAFDASNDSISSSRRRRSSPRAMSRAAGMSRMRAAPLTSAASEGMRA